jgi:biopolymer transport protein ExbD
MRSIRRTQFEMRIELMPLIDVIFLLLTFFIFALMVMSPALKMLAMETADLPNAAADLPGNAVTVSINEQGKIFVDREQATLEDIVPRLQAAVADEPSTTIYVASSEEGETDRLPIFLALYDTLAPAGLNVKLVSNRPVEPGTAPLPE